MPMQLFVGDVVMLKKPHPCGGYNWEILRTGMDFRIKCLTCGHSVMPVSYTHLDVYKRQSLYGAGN